MKDSGLAYSDIPERNILDTRFTGSGKTTSALEFISKSVSEGQSVVVLMQSYVRLENNYFSCFDRDLQSHSLIFKGKTQEGICNYWKELQETYEQGQRPKNECKICDYEDRCAYQRQDAQIDQFLSSAHGFCVLTTEHNLKHILSRCGDIKPVIIIDDVPLSSIITPEISITRSNLDTLSSYVRTPLLGQLVNNIIEYREGKDSEIWSSVCFEPSLLNNEVESFKVSVVGVRGRRPKPASLNFFFTMIDWSKGNFDLLYYPEKDRMIVVADASKFFKQYRVFYLNATPSIKDTYSMDRLGDYRHIHAEVQESKNFFIFQIFDSACAKQSVLESKKLREVFQEITSVFDQDLVFLDQKILIFSHKDLFQIWEREGILSGLNFSQEIYFGSNTRGTNDYKDYPISIIIGTPRYPPEYFRHPAFMPYRTDTTQPFGVPREISDKEAKSNLLQMIGRTLRHNPSDPDQTKIVIVFTDIDIAEDCQKQNGGKVILSGINSRNLRETLIRKLKATGQKALRDRIFLKITSDIDSQLLSGLVRLDEVSDFYSRRLSLFAKSTIKNELEKIYETKLDIVDHNGRKIETRMITKKKADP